MTKKKRKNLLWGIIGIGAGIFWMNILGKIATWEHALVDAMLYAFLVVIPLAGGILNMYMFLGKDDEEAR